MWVTFCPICPLMMTQRPFCKYLEELPREKVGLKKTVVAPSLSEESQKAYYDFESAEAVYYDKVKREKHSWVLP